MRRRASSTPETFSWFPRVAARGRDVGILWQEIVFSGGTHGGEIFFARSTDGGVTFSVPMNLSETIAGDGKGRLDADTWDNGSLDLARGAEGEVHAVWTEYEGALWYRRSEDGGATFAPAVQLAGSRPAPARGPSLAVAPGGAVHVVWTIGEERTADVRVASSRDGGRSFDVPRLVERTVGHSDAPKVAVDGAGTVHIVFAESPSDRSGGYHVRYTRRPGGAAEFEPSRALVGFEDGGAHHPSIAVDGRGGVYVVAERTRSREERPRALLLVRSVNGGAHFESRRPLDAISGGELGIDGSQQGMLGEKVAVTPGGMLAVVNSTFRPGERSHVWLLRGRAE